MNLLKQFAGQAVTYGVATILSRLVYYLLVTVLLTHILGSDKAEFGTYAFFYAYATIIVTLLSFRLDTALFRFGNKSEDSNKAFSTSLITVAMLAIGLAVIGTLFSQPIAEWLGFPDDKRYVQWFSYILAFDIVNLIPFAKLRLDNKAKTFAWLKVFNVLISTVLILFFLIVLPRYADGTLSFMPEMKAIIDWVFIANLIASASLFLLLLPVMKGSKMTIDTPLLKKMVIYAFPLVVVSICNALIQYFNAPLQEMFLEGGHKENLEEAGVYDVMRRVAGLFVMFTTAFNYAAEPFFFNNSSEETRESLYGKISRLYLLVGGLIVIGMYLGVDLIKHLFDENYWEGLYLLPILLIAYLLLGLYYNISIWYKLSDKTKYGAYISIIGCMLTLGISIMFLPSIGYAASAIATLVSYTVMVVLGYLWGQKHYPISYPIKKILLDLTIIVLILIAGFCVRQNFSGPLLYLSFVGLLAGYVLYMWRSEKKEWKAILRIST